MSARRILHIITGLNVGGAENMLAKLVEQNNAEGSKLEQEVFSLLVPGQIAPRIRAAGVPVTSLNLRRSVDMLVNIGPLIKAVGAFSPDIIVGWMHHGFMSAWMAQKFLKNKPPVIWNVRHSLSDIKHEPLPTQAILRFASMVSKSAAAIIYNSHASKEQYGEIGFSDDRAIVVANGFDCEKFSPNLSARAKLNEMVDVDADTPVIGMVARHHPMKDPGSLIRAFDRSRQATGKGHLLIVGKGMDLPPEDVATAMSEIQSSEHITLHDQRLDVAEWLPGLDILVMPSAWGDAFPNVLGEAMACGVACLATDVGDAKYIIDDARRISPPQDPAALAENLQQLVSMTKDERQKIGHQGRARIVQHFSMSNIADQYSAVYQRSLKPVPQQELVSAV